MTTYLQCHVWRARCLSHRPPSGWCPVMYKWDCKRVRVVVYRSGAQAVMERYAREGTPVFLSLDPSVSPAMPYPRRKATKKGAKAYKLRRRGNTLAERNEYR